jgi:hypothetical protein
VILSFAELSLRLLTFFHRGYPSSQYLLSIGAGSEPFTGRALCSGNWSIADRRQDRVLSSRHLHTRSLSTSVCMGGSASGGRTWKAFCKYFEFSFSFFILGGGRDVKLYKPFANIFTPTALSK